MIQLAHPDIKRIHVFLTLSDTARQAGQFIIDFVASKPEAVVSFATGHTMIPVYEYIAEKISKDNTDFSKITLFHLDERYPIEETHESSFVKYVIDKIMTPFKIYNKNAHLINGLAPNSHKEAQRYNELIKEYPVDLSIVGFGPPPHPHLGFNESGTPFNKQTHVAKLAAGTLKRDKNRGESVPKYAITQGLGNIFAAKNILGIAYGEDKGVGLANMLNKPISTKNPASGLRTVGSKVTLFIDQEAADEISG